ncbi:hypothetical protein MHYP_G00026240 [Metynnis hypsauchen]
MFSPCMQGLGTWLKGTHYCKGWKSLTTALNVVKQSVWQAYGSTTSKIRAEGKTFSLRLEAIQIFQSYFEVRLSLLDAPLMDHCIG